MKQKNWKVLFHSLLLVLILIGNVLPAFAQTPGQTPPDVTYDNYKYLFNTATVPADHPTLIVGPNTTKNQSGGETFAYAAPIPDTQTKKVIGLWLKFNFTFSTQNNNTSFTWDHIAADTQGFILRSCNSTADGSPTLDSCIYSKVPYKNILSTTVSDAASFTDFFGGILTQGTLPFIQSVFGLPSNTQIADTAIKRQIENAAVIYRKDQNGNYISHEEHDLFAVNWFPLNTPGNYLSQDTINQRLATSSQNVSLWYCGSKVSGTPSDADPTNAAVSGTGSTNPDPTHMQQFGTLCGGSSYFKIAETTAPKITSFTDATTQFSNTDLANASTRQTDESPLPTCDILNGYRPFSNNSESAQSARGSFVGCIAQVFYYGIYSPIQWFAGIMGNIFDFFLGYSLDDASYRADFIVTAWKVIRDISNIFFILILVWTGLAAVFDIGGISMKKVVPNLIVNALIINFSLFATRLVIDVSNITARIFYNQVHIQKGNTGVSLDTTAPGGYKPLSVKIVSVFDPQKLFDTKNYSAQALPKAAGITDETQDAGTVAKIKGTNTYALYFIVVSAIAAAIVFGMAMMFWKSGFFFLGRVIGLYIVMIFSPFAFLTRKNMPLIGGIQRLKWDDWVGELTSYALLAPIFVFFLYIIYTLATSAFITQITGTIAANGGIINTIIAIAIPMLIIYFMVSYGVDIAKRYAGQVGAMVQQSINKVAGFAGGAALGVTAVAGSRVIGGVAKSLDQSRVGVGIRNLASNKWLGWAGRGMQKGLNKAQSGSFDFRQSSLGQGVLKQMGVDTNQKGLDIGRSIGLPGLSTEQRKGGIDAAIKRRQEKKVEQAGLLEEKMDVDAYNKRKKKHYDNIKKRLSKKFEADMTEKYGKKTLDEWKKDPTLATYTAHQNVWVKDTKRELQDALIKKGPEQLRSATEMTGDRRKEFIDNLKQGSLMTMGLEALAGTSILGERVSDILGATIGATAGALIGQQITTAGDRAAAKKLGERTKIEKEINEVRDTVEKGFKDLLAFEMYQSSGSFTNLNETERRAIAEGKKSMYDILTAEEKRAVDQRRRDLTDDQKNDYYDLVATRLSTPQKEMKKLNEEIKAAEKAWKDAAAANTGNQKQLFEDFKNLLAEKNENLKAKRKYENYREFIKKEQDRIKAQGENK